MDLIHHKGVWEIYWTDHYSLNGWNSFSAYKESAEHGGVPCKSVGYLVFEDKKSITLIQSINENELADSMTIIKSLIVSKKQLSEAE